MSAVTVFCRFSKSLSYFSGHPFPPSNGKPGTYFWQLVIPVLQWICRCPNLVWQVEQSNFFLFSFFSNLKSQNHIFFKKNYVTLEPCAPVFSTLAVGHWLGSFPIPTSPQTHQTLLWKQISTNEGSFLAPALLQTTRLWHLVSLWTSGKFLKLHPCCSKWTGISSTLWFCHAQQTAKTRHVSLENWAF